MRVQAHAAVSKPFGCFQGPFQKAAVFGSRFGSGEQDPAGPWTVGERKSSIVGVSG